MKCLLCLCFKRKRATYDLSSKINSYTDSKSIIPTVTSTPLPLPVDFPVESNHETINSSSDTNTIGINHTDSLPIASTESDGYASIASVRLSQPVLNDVDELYAKVDKTRKAKNALKIRTEPSEVVAVPLPRGSLSASATTFSSPSMSLSSSHRSELVVIFTQSPIPFSVYTNTSTETISNSHDKISIRPRPRYNENITRQSFLRRVQRWEQEKVQMRQNSSAEREPQATDSSDSYAEIIDRNMLSATDGNPPSFICSGPANSSEIDEISEQYATIPETNHTKEQSITDTIFQDIDSMIF